jgi:hypothetical protein
MHVQGWASPFNLKDVILILDPPTQALTWAVKWYGAPRRLTMCAACLAHAARAPTCRPLRAPLWRVHGLAYRLGLEAAASTRCWLQSLATAWQQTLLPGWESHLLSWDVSWPSGLCRCAV